MEDPSVREYAISALNSYDKTMSGIIESVLDSITKFGVDKIDDNIFPMMAAFGTIEKLVRSINCNSVPHLEEKLQNLATQTKPKDSDLDDGVESYFRICTEWEKLLDKCDKLLGNETDLKKEASLENIPSKFLGYTLKFLLASGETQKKAISDEGCQVVIMSFGTKEGATRWKQEVDCPFPVYLDRSRELYSYFGMRRSIKKVFCQDTLAFYVETKLGGGEFLPPYQGDDLIQMGGDILFSTRGAVELSHISKNPADRPNIQSVIQLMNERNGRK